MLFLQIKTFEQLSKDQLYDLLALRNEVFILEQECPYQDIDFKDQKAFHVIGTINGELMAYARLFMAGDYFEEASIGRVIIKNKYRQNQYGQDLMNFSIAHLKSKGVKTIDISAQVYLLKFYQNLGFDSISEHYLEDDIPHVLMRIKPPNPRRGS